MMRRDLHKICISSKSIDKNNDNDIDRCFHEKSSFMKRALHTSPIYDEKSSTLELCESRVPRTKTMTTISPDLFMHRSFHEKSPVYESYIR